MEMKSLLKAEVKVLYDSGITMKKMMKAMRPNANKLKTTRRHLPLRQQHLFLSVDPSKSLEEPEKNMSRGRKSKTGYGSMISSCRGLSSFDNHTQEYYVLWQRHPRRVQRPTIPLAGMVMFAI